MGGLLMKRWGRSGGGGTGTDPQFSNVKLLLGFNGADASTTVTDESPAAHGNAGVNGNAQIDTAQLKFGTASGLFDGTGDSFSYSGSSDWAFAAGEFTVEAWIRFNAITTWHTIISTWTDTFTNRDWTFDYSTAAGTLRFLYTTAGTNATVVITEGAWSPSTNTWYHVAADCDSSRNLRVYANGTMLAKRTSAGTIFNSGTSLRVGQQGGQPFDFNGWIDEVRVTKGVARYASDGGFSVPTSAFPRS